MSKCSMQSSVMPCMELQRCNASFDNLPFQKIVVSCETFSIFRAIEKRERYFLNVPVFCFILHYAAAMVASIWS